MLVGPVHGVVLRHPLFCCCYARFGHGIMHKPTGPAILDMPHSHSLLLRVARSQVQEPPSVPKSTQNNRLSLSLHPLSNADENLLPPLGLLRHLSVPTNFLPLSA